MLKILNDAIVIESAAVGLKLSFIAEGPFSVVTGQIEGA